MDMNGAAKELLESAANLWETVTVATTLSSAVFTSVAALLAIFEKRKPWFQRSGQIVSLFAATFALAGAFSLIVFTTRNRAVQRIESAERLRLQSELKATAEQAKNALADASRAMSDLKQAKEEVVALTGAQTKLALQLDAAYRQLAETRREVKKLAPRVISKETERIFAPSLSPYVGQELEILYLQNSTESQAFAKRLGDIVATRGWIVRYFPMIAMGDLQAQIVGVVRDSNALPDSARALQRLLESAGYRIEWRADGNRPADQLALRIPPKT